MGRPTWPSRSFRSKGGRAFGRSFLQIFGTLYALAQSVSCEEIPRTWTNHGGPNTYLGLHFENIFDTADKGPFNG